MEKRKWLWKRKSSEKSPCETESSGSVSSHSERFSDDQDAVKGSPDHNTQSPEPELSSKAVAITENLDDSSLKTEDINYRVKSLTERLSAALVNVSAKEDLVKQHAKVAEEAVAGWEKAENEVAILKQQLEASIQQNSSLEDRVSHLDGALKECVRQLRQARDEQDQKIQEAVSKKTQEWESTKCKLDNELLELKNKGGDNNPESSARVDPDLCLKVEFLEKENSALNLEIQAQMEELEIRAIERDLSTQAAETASKQHLESIKKVAKLEAECRKLKAVLCKSSLGNDHKSTIASSTYVESFTDSHSDNGERLNAVESNTRKLRSFELNKCELNSSDSWASALIAELDQFKNEKTVKNLPTSSIEINLMDDFLEMEQLAALQPTENSCLESEVVADESNNRESVIRTELEAMIQQIAELEEKLQKLDTEKAELETALRESRDCIEANRSNNRESVLKIELEAMNQRTAQLEDKLEKSELKQAELEIALTKSEDYANEFKYAESVLRTELEAMIHRTAELEEKLEKLEMKKAGLETALTESQDCGTKLKRAESNLRTELETMIHRTVELEENLKKLETAKADLETALTKSQHCANESKNRESSLRTELEAVIQRMVELEEQSDKLETEKSDLEIALSKSQDCIEASRLQLIEAEMKLEELKEELNIAKESKKMIEAQLISLEAETRTMFAKVKILEEEIQRERAMSAEIAIKCQDLEEELSREKDEVELRQTTSSNSDLKIKQEDLAVAATKLAECQKTIASLGNQLKSLATLEDFLIDASNITVPAGAPLIHKTGQHWKMHSNQTFSPRTDSNSSKVAEESSAPALSENHENPSPPSSSSSSSSTSATVQSTHVNSEKNRNGFAKFFSRTKSGIRLEI
ncbi:filament-like plant protein 1 isoform X2 [Humulus lupulus]|uniref:filament-like plant protein 1 isoform X2 n=1 Tax=Humulus lupulus TaxID=3486 RepID=UPI002B414AF0|nr:filament-like plant protein 1 isoform X2 [Humulus lupulus]